MIKTQLSVVVPIYSGSQYVQDLFQRIKTVREQWEQEDAPLALGELIFVDDQSIDNSLPVLQKISEENQWVHALSLSRNFGQHPATIAGILHSSGNWVITLDEDLQHPPEKIEQLLYKAIKEEKDVVYANPQNGPHGKVSRDFTSSYFKKMMVWLTGDKHIAYFNSFRLMRGEIARSAASVCGPDTYFDVSLTWFTQAIGQVSLEIQDQRMAENNKSGYSFLKLIEHARRLILSSKINLYRSIAFLGILIFFVGVLYSGFIIFNEIMHPGKFGSRGWPSLIITTMIFGATSIILLSIILEYLSLVVLKAQGKPVFFVINRSAPAELLTYLEKRNGRH